MVNASHKVALIKFFSLILYQRNRRMSNSDAVLAPERLEDIDSCQNERLHYLF